jgi:mRNA-degrading endonuclease toxin of MazEF toxin-antitoxin module
MTTPYTTTYSRGEVILVPFQFTDRPVAKMRPAVILSSPTYNAGRQELIVAALTSRIRSPLLPGDRLLGDWQTAGLPRESVVTAIIRTVKHSMVSRRIGKLTGDDLNHVDEGLRSALAL